MALGGAPGEGLGVLAGICVGSVGHARRTWFWSPGIAAVRSQPALPGPPPAPRLETAKSESGKDNPDDADQVDLETHPKGHGQKPQVDRSGRHQPDHRASGHQLAGVSSRAETTEKL